MSVHYHLSDDVRKLSDFTEVSWQERPNGRTEFDRFVGGTQICSGSQGLFVSQEVAQRVPLPEVLKDLVRSVTVVDHTDAERVPGIYRLKGLEAEVRCGIIQMAGNLDDLSTMMELRCLIKAGKIWPAERWDTPQRMTFWSILRGRILVECR